MLLSIARLRIDFCPAGRRLTAVDGVDLTVAPGQRVVLVGESGCGKSATALAVMRLVPADAGASVTGSILFEGTDLLRLDERRMRRIRGGRIAMVFQEPFLCLNPVMTIERQIVEAYRAHRRVRASAARAHAQRLLEWVGIADPQRRLRAYPHQLSGGMRQRVMIAIALACGPALLIADEPTTALDVTVQAQILDLLRRLQRETGMAVLLITHDLAVAAQFADEIHVMYAGRIVEHAPAGRLLAHPRHPYTQALLRTLPRSGVRLARLEAIPGSVPDPAALPGGCRFHPRCAAGADDPVCRSRDPALRRTEGDHDVACWKAPGYAAVDERSVGGA